MKRRTLVKAIGTAGIAASFPFHALGVTGEKKMKVLFMGGTGFIGPHMVRALINAGSGHEGSLRVDYRSR
ncbi:MAG: hypothetical protein WBN41_13260 [Lysobacterales bacterium]